MTLIHNEEKGKMKQKKINDYSMICKRKDEPGKFSKFNDPFIIPLRVFDFREQ
jgi:hypothetical protein